MPSMFALGYLVGFNTASISCTKRARLAAERGFSAHAAARLSASLAAAATEGLGPCATAIMSFASFCFCSGVTAVPDLMLARSVCNCVRLAGGGGGAVCDGGGGGGWEGGAT